MASLVDLTGRRILVTGASSGIGRATAILLSDLGAKVVLVGRNQEELFKTQAAMNFPEQHQCIAYDLNDIDGIENIFKKIFVDDMEKLTGLVHAAGVFEAIPLKNLNYDNMDKIMRINYYAFLALVRAYSLKKYSQGGSVVAVSSVASEHTAKCQTLYAASKAALNISVRSLSLELIKKNIRINAVLPGSVDTKMVHILDELYENYAEMLGKSQLLGLGKPEQVANIIAFLLSDAASFMTGRSYHVDGGLF